MSAARGWNRVIAAPRTSCPVSASSAKNRPKAEMSRGLMSELQYAENAQTHNQMDGVGNSKSPGLAACFKAFSRDFAALLQQLHGRRGDRMTVDGLLISLVAVRVMLIRGRSAGTLIIRERWLRPKSHRRARCFGHPADAVALRGGRAGVDGIRPTPHRIVPVQRGHLRVRARRK